MDLPVKRYFSDAEFFSVVPNTGYETFWPFLGFNRGYETFWRYFSPSGGYETFHRFSGKWGHETFSGRHIQGTKHFEFFASGV